MTTQTTQTVRQTLIFGAHWLVPATARAAWGARAIPIDSVYGVRRTPRRRASLDIVHDRQGGAGELAGVERIVRVLNGGLLDAAQARVGELDGLEEDGGAALLGERDGVALWGESTGGYVYLAAWEAA